MSWERVDETEVPGGVKGDVILDPQIVTTERFRVPGGWFYRVVTSTRTHWEQKDARTHVFGSFVADQSEPKESS